MGGVHLYLQALTAALDGGYWWASCAGCFTPGERTSDMHWTGGWVGPRAGLNTMTKKET